MSVMTRLSPTKTQAVIMGMWFLASAYGQYFAGLLGANIAEASENSSNFDKLMVYTEGYKQLASGEIRENITPIIYRNGLQEGSFKRFSGGEKGRLEFAIMLSLQQLINASSDSGGLELLLADEIFESIDGVGISNMIDSAKDLNKTVMLTTHVNVNRDHDVILIEKDINGSKIIIT
jgi:DNA repair exonuclease SbcCD ATPase subunit